MVPILINKDMFEPSFNYLKFMIQNRNYFCTNLIQIPVVEYQILKLLYGISIW